MRVYLVDENSSFNNFVNILNFIENNIIKNILIVYN